MENHAEQARILSIQSQECAKRLQTLKYDAITKSTEANPVINRTSIDTARSVRSITDSILSLYGHESLYGTPSESEGGVLGTGSMQVEQARISRIIEDNIRKNAVVDEDRPDSPFISPSDSRYSLDSITARDDQTFKDVDVEHSNHLAATELGIWTNIDEDSLDQHQYDSERVVSSFVLRYPCGSTEKESYIPVLLSAVRHYEEGKDWRHYELCITTTHRVRHLQLDERPLMLELLFRQLPLYFGFRLRRLVVPVPWEYVEYDLDAMTYSYPINHQHCCHEVLAAMLQAVDDSLVANSYELCLNSRGEALMSRLRMGQKPLALYQECLQEGRKPFFLIRLKDVARTS